MNTFSTRFLEPMQSDTINPDDAWNWQPQNPDIKRIYATGNKTASKQSTYSAERDHEVDYDRPNEGA